MNLWQWFLAHGDKLLAGVSTALLALQQSGTIPPSWVPAVTAVLAVLHTVVLPEPTASSTSAGAPK